MQKILFAGIILIHSYVKAQTISNTRAKKMLWLGYYQSKKINSKYTVNSDLQIRFNESEPYNNTMLIRTGLFRSISNITEIGIGIADFINPISNKLFRNEFRIYQEVGLKSELHKWILKIKFKLEERYFRNSGKINPNELFSGRARLKTDIEYPLSNSIKIEAGNEVMYSMMNFNQAYLDQNRTYLGIKFPIHKFSEIQLAFMHLLQNRLKDKVLLEPTNILRINFLQNF